MFWRCFVLWERENFVKRSFSSKIIECLLHELQCLIKTKKSSCWYKGAWIVYVLCQQSRTRKGIYVCECECMCTHLWERGRWFISVLRVFPQMWMISFSWPLMWTKPSNLHTYRTTWSCWPSSLERKLYPHFQDCFQPIVCCILYIRPESKIMSTFKLLYDDGLTII